MMSRTYLGVSRIGIENVREKLARASHTGNDQSMNVEAIHHKKVGKTVLLF